RSDSTTRRIPSVARRDVSEAAASRRREDLAFWGVLDRRRSTIRRFEMQVFERRRASVAESARRPSAATPELELLRAVERHARLSRWLWKVVRTVGALSLLAVGAVHLQQYLTLYSAIPTIGTLFVLNFAGATAIGLGLLAP